MKHKTIYFSNRFSNAEAEQQTSGYVRSHSHGISLSEHYHLDGQNYQLLSILTKLVFIFEILLFEDDCNQRVMCE